MLFTVKRVRFHGAVLICDTCHENANSSRITRFTCANDSKKANDPLHINRLPFTPLKHLLEVHILFGTVYLYTLFLSSDPQTAYGAKHEITAAFVGRIYFLRLVYTTPATPTIPTLFGHSNLRES